MPRLLKVHEKIDNIAFYDYKPTLIGEKKFVLLLLRVTKIAVITNMFLFRWFHSLRL